MQDCHICLEPLLDDESYRSSCCSHAVYHHRCLSMWLRVSRQCPQCYTPKVEIVPVAETPTCCCMPCAVL